MIKYADVITTKPSNVLLDVFLLIIISGSIFFSLNQEVSAFVTKYLQFVPTAEFVYPHYTKDNQSIIEIKNKQNIDKIFFNGIECRDKVNVQLQEGNNDFLFTLTGRGKEIEQKVTIVKDTKLPEFTTEYKLENKKVKDGHIAFTGVLSENGKVFINNTECTQEVKVNCDYTVKEKENIVVLIKDEAGNEVKKEFTVEVDNVSPTVELSAESPTYQDKVAINIKGSEALSEAKINDVSASKKDDTTFSGEVNLNIGNNTFHVTAFDLAGNEVKKDISIERKEAPKVQTPTNNTGGNNNSGGNNNNGGYTPPTNACSSISIQLYNVSTPVFAGETQTADVKLTCSNGQGYSGQSVSLTVRYSNGTTRTYSQTTNGSGIASFSFGVEAISGNATMTAKYSAAQTSVTFTVN